MAGGRHGQQLGHRVQAVLAQGGDHVRELRGVDVAHVEVDVRGALLADLAEDRAGHLVARCELLDEALPLGVEQRGALAPDRLGDQEALAARDTDDRGGVELDELEIGQRGAGGVGEQQPDAERARRVGRARPQRGRAARGQHGRPGADRPPVLEGDPDAAALVGGRPQRGGARALEHQDPGLGDDDGRELADDAAARRAAAGVRDAAAPVATLQAQRQRALLVDVEDHAELPQVGDGAWRLADQDVGGGPAHGAPAGDLGVPPVQIGCVVGAERGGQPPLGPVGGGLRERRGRDEHDVGALAGGGQRGVEAGTAGADDAHVGLDGGIGQGGE